MLNQNYQDPKGSELCRPDEPLRFEKLLFYLSSAFVEVSPDEVDDKIADGLKEIVEFLGVDRCGLQEFPPGKKELHTTHAYRNDGIETFPNLVTDERMPWCISVLRRGEPVAISRLGEDLPDEAVREKEHLLKQGVKSILAIPLGGEGAVTRVLSFEAFRCARGWPDELVKRLKLSGEIFANALMCKRYRLALSEKHRVDQLISDLSYNFLNMPPEEVDANLKKELKRIVGYLEADRAIFAEFKESGEEALILHSWTRSGFEPFSEKISGTEFAWLMRKMRNNQVVIFSRLNELPEEAGHERNFFRSRGIKSHISIPIAIGESVTGFLSLSTIRKSRTWPPELIKSLTLIADIFANIIIRKQNQEAIGRLSEFERLLSELSVKFVNLPTHKVDTNIDNTLRRMMAALNLDRISLIEIDDDKKKVKITHSVSLPGIPTIPSEFLSERVSWYTEKISRGEIIRYERLPDDLPDAPAGITEFILKYGIKSMLGLPLVINGKTLGALSFAAVKTVRMWSDGQVRQLKLVSELFGKVLERKWNDEKLSKAFGEIKALKSRLEDEVVYLRKEVELKHEHHAIVGDSVAIKKALGQIEQVAGTDTTVLLLGETGTGKELLAQAVHDHSNRRNRPMVKVNCAALPASLVESELFGREKGAFTGAITKQVGRFEMADGSTLFLDEVGELPLDLQVKLLRFLQEGQFERLGSPKTISVDVRLVTATNRDLEKAIREGTFRQDLYYRLNVFPISVPHLRERSEDIPQLVWEFVRKFEKSMGKRIDSISRSSMDALKGYAWPGNVRELRNVIEHAMIISRSGRLGVKVPETLAPATPCALTLEAVERNHILSVLENTGWRIKGRGGAAEILGLKPPTLYFRIKKLGIQRPETGRGSR